MPDNAVGVGRPPYPTPPSANEILTQNYLRDAAGQYIDFTPVLTAGAGFAYGANAFQLGRYKRIGSQCHVYFIVTLGGVGLATGAGAVWTISLPFLPTVEQFPQVWINIIPAGCVFVNTATAGTSTLTAPLLTPNTQSFQLIVPGLANPTQRLGAAGSPAMAQNSSIEGSFIYEVAG